MEHDKSVAVTLITSHTHSQQRPHSERECDCVGRCVGVCVWQRQFHPRVGHRPVSGRPVGVSDSSHGPQAGRNLCHHFFVVCRFVVANDDNGHIVCFVCLICCSWCRGVAYFTGCFVFVKLLHVKQRILKNIFVWNQWFQV